MDFQALWSPSPGGLKDEHINPGPLNCISIAWRLLLRALSGQTRLLLLLSPFFHALFSKHKKSFVCCWVFFKLCIKQFKVPQCCVPVITFRVKISLQQINLFIFPPPPPPSLCVMVCSNTDRCSAQRCLPTLFRGLCKNSYLRGFPWEQSSRRQHMCAAFLYCCRPAVFQHTEQEENWPCVICRSWVVLV